MSTTRHLAATAALLLTGLVLAAGFAGWLKHMPDLFLAYAESAVSWCF